MKTKLVVIFSFCLALSSCSKWHYGHGHGHDDDDDITFIDKKKVEEGGADDQVNKIELSKDELIVKLDPNMSEERLKELLAILEIKDTIGCSCGDTTIKKWTVDDNLLDIEKAIGKLKDESSGKGDVEGDQGFTVQLSRIPDFQPSDGQRTPFQLIAPSNNNIVNIAILDTGIDFDRDLFPPASNPYLFKADDYSGCYPAGSGGWNFDEGSPDIFDRNGHGTYVKNIISDILDNAPVPIDYRILPLKVFNDQGKGSYWNIVCAMGYIKDINQNGGNIRLVNASFGGPMDQGVLQGKTILSGILEDLKEETLVISSAGNGDPGTDNDGGPIGHFISSYPSDNLIGVGGYTVESGNIVLDPRSNYGGTSIDVALEFDNYEVIFNTFDPLVKERTPLAGTSYAAAAMTGLAAELDIRSGRPSIPDLKDLVFALSMSEAGLNNDIDGNKAIIR